MNDKDINEVRLSGRIGKEPETRATPAGDFLLKMPLAVNYESEGRPSVTTWVDIVVWGRQAEMFQGKLHKGNKIIVFGKLSIRSYQSKEGLTKYATSINASYIAQIQPYQSVPPTKQSAYAPEKIKVEEFKDTLNQDDIPF